MKLVTKHEGGSQLKGNDKMTKTGRMLESSSAAKHSVASVSVFSSSLHTYLYSNAHASLRGKPLMLWTIGVMTVWLKSEPSQPNHFNSKAKESHFAVQNKITQLKNTFNI